MQRNNLAGLSTIRLEAASAVHAKADPLAPRSESEVFHLLHNGCAPDYAGILLSSHGTRTQIVMTLSFHYQEQKLLSAP